MDKHLQRLRLSRGKMPNYRGVLDLAEKLLEEKRRVKERWSFPSLQLDPIKVRIQMQGGFPYLRPSELPLDPVQTHEYFSDLLGILKEQDSEEYELLKKTIETSNFVFDHFLKRLLENQLTERGLAQELGKEGGLLLFFMIQSLKPAFEVHAEAWRREQAELSFIHGFCPFCGGLPGLGEIREEGKRVLHCSLCGTEWLSLSRLRRFAQRLCPREMQRLRP